MHNLRIIATGVALFCSVPALADHWSTFGGHEVGRSGSVIRYSVTKRGYDDYHWRRSRYDDVNVTMHILVADVPPATRWRPTWGGYDDHGRGRGQHGYVFDPARGYIPESEVRILRRNPGSRYGTPPRHGYYENGRYYPGNAMLIEPGYRDDYRDEGATLFRNRHGECFERETNSQGRTVRRRVADFKCDF